MPFRRLGQPFSRAALLVLALLLASPLQAASVLLITTNNGSLTAEETVIRDQLLAWGHTVNTIWDNDSQAAYDAALPSNNLVYIPRGVTASQVDYKVRETTLGVLSELPALADEMGFSTSGGGTNGQTELTILNDTHTITNPFSVGTLSVGTSSISLARLGGTTAAGATVLAQYGNNNDTLVVVDTGGTLATAYNGSSVAFGRRVYSPFALGSNYASLTADGLTLVERSLAWLLGLNETLVAHWKLDETSGTTAADSSGYGNPGSVTGSPAWNPAVIDNGFSFDGATRIEAAGLLGNPSSFTLAAWANLTTADAEGAEIISLGDRVLLRLDEAGVSKAAFYDGSSFVEVAVNQTFAGSGWHHFAATFDAAGDVFQLYVDGVEVASTATTANVSYAGGGSNTTIGRHGNGSTSRDFTGAIDDVRVYNYALTDTAVAKLYGLVGHWKLDESSGSTAADSTPFANDATLAGSENWSTDCAGIGTFDFDGSASHFSAPNASHLQPSQRLSIAAWVRGDAWDSGGNTNTILRKGNSNTNDYKLIIANSGRVMLGLDDNDSNGVQSATTLSLARWYHVVGTWDGTTAKIYIDGALDYSEPRSGPIGVDTLPLYIGGRPSNDLFDGMMRDVRLYNRALLPEEVARLAGTEGHWKFDEGSGSIAADGSPAGNDATLTGGATWTTDCAGIHALLANGSGGIAETESPFAPPGTGTIAFWVRPTSTPSGSTSVLGVGDDWEVRQVDDGTLVFDLGADGGSQFVTTSPLAAGRWYHVAATFDEADNSYAVYIDGQLQKSGTNANPMSPQPAGVLSFGTSTGSGQYWAGALRDVRIYRRKLCSAEIAYLSGLIGRWVLDETTGTTAYDSSGLANDGTYVDGVTLAGSAGPLSGTVAADFDGNNDYVAIGNESLYDVTGPTTIALWIKVASFTKNTQSIFMKGSQWRLTRNGNSDSVRFGCNGLSTSQVSGTQSVNDGQWHHVAGVYDGDSLDLYIDGVLDASVSSSGSISTTNQEVQIGRNSQGASREFHGALYDARIYSRALCPSEIADLADPGAGGLTGVRIIKWVEVQ